MRTSRAPRNRTRPARGLESRRCSQHQRPVNSRVGGSRTLTLRFKRPIRCRYATTPVAGRAAFKPKQVKHENLLEKPGRPYGSRTRLAGLKDRRPHRKSNGPASQGKQKGQVSVHVTPGLASIVGKTLGVTSAEDEREGHSPSLQPDTWPLWIPHSDSNRSASLLSRLLDGAVATSANLLHLLVRLCRLIVTDIFSHRVVQKIRRRRWRRVRIMCEIFSI